MTDYNDVPRGPMPDVKSRPNLALIAGLIIAALCARGTSVIDDAQMVDRGYERIDERLRALGAGIERKD